MNKQGPRIRDAERCRAALLAAATEVFARRGYEGARVHEIARLAKANKAMISYHFGGKRRLYEDVVIALISAAEPAFRQIRESSDPAEARLRRMIRALADFAQRHPAFPTLVLREHLSGGTRLQERVLPHFIQFFHTTKGIVEQGIAEGAFRNVDPHSVHLSLVGSLMFFQASRPMRESAGRRKLKAGIPDISDFVSHTEQLFLNGLKKI
jgi:AcrR family transcriptional regulator